jgi:putative phosphoesterase
MQAEQPEHKEIVVGVVSDTHGRLPPKLLKVLEGVSFIIHAGDLNTPDVLEQFRQAKKLVVVRGNSDLHHQFRSLPRSEVVQVGDVFIYVIHNLLDMEIDPRAAGFQVVVHGHLHVPHIQMRQEVLYLNPGSPSFPRMGSKPCVAFLRINQELVRAELIDLED